MVSIDNRITYKKKLESSAKLMVFDYFINGESVGQISDTDMSDSDKQFFGILSAIQKNNKAAFEEIFAVKSKSNPTRESNAPFVNDDYLIFSLITAIKKFNIDTVWIKNIVSLRNRDIITITFDNILNDNYTSTSNQAEVVLIFLQLYDQSMINKMLLDAAYKSIAKNTVLFEIRNDFQILSALSAYDLIIGLKEAPDGSEIQLLRRFNTKFIYRTKFISWFLQVSLFSAGIYGLLKLPVYSPETVKIINDYGYVFTIVGATGITALSNYLGLINQKLHEYTMRLLGYPKEMYKQPK